MRDALKTNIIFLITKGSWGGAQSYVFDLAVGLPKDKYEVSVICGQGSDLGARLRRENINAYELPGLGRDVSLWKDWRTLRELTRLLRGIEPDIIHLNSSKMGLLGALAGRRAGIKKIVFTGHGWASNEDRPWWQKMTLRLLQWLSILLATDVIAVSSETKEQVADWPSFRKKIFVIHNGLGLVDFYDQAEAREKLGLAREKFIIGTVAELHKNKGLDILIPAFAAFNKNTPDNKAVLAIIGQGEERENLEVLITENNLSDKVFLLGRIEEARKYLKGFDLFVLPSRTEALPYALLEAAQAGLPIIASRVGGIPEIINEGASGLLVEPSNTKKLASAIEQIYKNKALAQHLGEEAQKVFAEKFSLEKMIEKTIAVYCDDKSLNLPACKK